MPVQEQFLDELSRTAPSRLDLWTDFISNAGVEVMSEIGVFTGRFAERVLDACPQIARYYMIDPWRHLDDWNKPANRPDEVFEGYLAEAMQRTEAFADKRVVLRGTTVEVIDQIPDGSLDLAYVDGDHTLRGITVDLVRVLPKVRVGGFIAGDDFGKPIWQHDTRYEPTLVFPFAVYFAEAIGARVHALPHRQFLIEKRDHHAFEFVDHTHQYTHLTLKEQLAALPTDGSTPRKATGSSTSGTWGRVKNALGKSRS